MKKNKITTTLFFFMCSLIFVKSAMAQSVIFSDNFDDNDFSDWKVQRNAIWANPSEPCKNNDQLANWEILDGELGITIDSPPCVTEITPVNLDMTNIPKFEYEFDWNMKESTVMDRNIIFIWKDKDNWYDVKILGNSLLIQKFVNGIGYGIEGNVGNYNFNADQKYHFKITKIDNDFEVSVDGNSVIKAKDNAPYITGYKTLGLQASSGAIRRSVSYFDNIVVRSLDDDTNKDEHLDAPLYKQTDPQWKNLEYDHASQWSPTAVSIGRWGCTLSSAAMVLNYHGINKLADGAPLTPATLNTWLNSQKDGYIDGVKSGYVNFAAITRLTRELNEKYQTTKLEYKRLASDLTNKLIAEIDAKRPAILEIPGHFLVGDGYTADKTDFYINDPAYALDLFSKHKTDLTSIRTLTPSNTDLSYLLLAHDPSITVSLTKLDGSPIAGLEEFLEMIKDPTDGSSLQTPTMTVHQVAKPIDGQYLLKVSRDEFGPFSFQFFAYDIQANPTDLSTTGLVGNQPLVFVIDYHREGASSAKQIKTLTNFRQDLKLMLDLGKITKSSVYNLLDQIASNGEKQPLTKQAHFVNLLKLLLKNHQSNITADGQQYLNQQLQAMETSG